MTKQTEQRAKKVSISYGAIGGTISEQLESQGFVFDKEQAEVFER